MNLFSLFGNTGRDYSVFEAQLYFDALAEKGPSPSDQAGFTTHKLTDRSGAVTSYLLWLYTGRDVREMGLVILQ